MAIGSVVSHLVVLVLGILFGAFALRRNPIKGAKTLDELETVYQSTKNKLLAQVRK